MLTNLEKTKIRVECFEQVEKLISELMINQSLEISNDEYIEDMNRYRHKIYTDIYNLIDNAF